MSQPFDGILIVDVTHVLAGASCGYQLALLGADVIKIESPHEPDPVRHRGTLPRMNEAGMGFSFLAQNSNKRSLSLDLKTAKGKEVFLKLAAKADVIIENFRTGSLKRMGLGYEDIRAFNPKIIYCSLTGFGQTGPQATRGALDPIIQAVTGVMDSAGYTEKGPIKSGGSFVDYSTGMTAAFAVSSALYQRQATGRGQRIDVAMLDVSLAFMGPQACAAAYRGPQTQKPYPREAGLDSYRAKDAWLQLASYNFRHNRRLWTLLGNEEFAAYSTWPELWDNAERMRAELKRRIAERTAAEWEAVFMEHEIPAAQVRTLDEAVDLEQIRQRGVMVDSPPFEGSEGMKVPNGPYKFEHGGPKVTRKAPALGEHNEEILASLGYSAREIAAMKQEVVI